MDLRSLRTFVAVVERRSFTGAATLLGYTQSAVSQQIGALEASLGVRLFERRPFALTPAAVRLAEHAGNILLRVDVATSELAVIDRPAATIVAATPFAAVTDEVARLVAAGVGMQEASTAELSIAGADEVATLVARRECSIGVVDGIVGPYDPLAHADPGLLTAMVVRVAPLAVAMAVDHPFAARATLAWTAVADACWIDAPHLFPRPGPGAAVLLDRHWARTRYDGREPSVLGALAAAGHGLALVPSWWRPSVSNISVVPISEPPWVHRVEALALRSQAADWSPLVNGVRAERENNRPNNGDHTERPTANANPGATWSARTA